MRQKGFAPIFIILGIILVFSLGVGGYIVSTKINNHNQLSSGNQSSSQPKTISNPATQATTTKDYCSMANGCPKDKCSVHTPCGGGTEGCMPGKPICEYKDHYLKDNYTEVSFGQVKQCVQEFITKNQSTYPTLTNLEIDENNSGTESSPCSPFDSTFNKKDRFCYFIVMHHKTDKNFPFAPQFYVGSQTCKVYWNLPDAFKTNVST